MSLWIIECADLILGGVVKCGGSMGWNAGILDVALDHDGVMDFGDVRMFGDWCKCG